MTHYRLELYAGEGSGSGAGRHLGVHLEGVQPRPHRVTHGGEGAVLCLMETDSRVTIYFSIVKLRERERQGVDPGRSLMLAQVLQTLPVWKRAYFTQ